MNVERTLRRIAREAQRQGRVESLRALLASFGHSLPDDVLAQLADIESFRSTDDFVAAALFELQLGRGA